jgi:hypothetical protein
MDTLSAVGGASLGAVASVGNFLDLPGSSIRDILAGENPLDQWLSPLSDVNRTSGRQLLERYGMRANRKTGMTGWLSDPGEGLRDIAGFGAEVLLDPFGPLTKGSKMATGAASLIDRAHPVVKGVASGAVNIFDRLPGGIGQVTKDRVVSLAKQTGRGLKAIFNAPSGGVTDEFAQGIKERATATADAAKQLADTMSIDLVETANRSGFNLNKNPDIDMNDPTNWLDDASPLMVKAREEQLFRVWEGTYDPTSAKLRQGDLVTPEGSNAFKEVEWVDRSSTGTKVKLVNDDKIYSDFDFDPKKQWLSQSVEIPQEVMDVAVQMKNFRDALKGRVHELGGNIGDLIDVVDFSPRRKNVSLARAESISGLTHSKWMRNKYASLVSTLQATGGRDMMYKGFFDGTPGVNALYGDSVWQNTVREINDLATGTGANNGPNFLPGYVGPRHVESFAEAIGMTPEDLWTRMQQMQPVNATDTRAFASTAAPGVFTVVRGGRMDGTINVPTVDGTARIDTAGMTDTSWLPDALQEIARELSRSGTASKLEINAPAGLADALKPLGYIPDGMNADGTERLVRKLFNAEDTQSTIKSYLPVDEFKARFNGFVAGFADQVRRGEIEGVQPGRGWHKSYTSYRPDVDAQGKEIERVFNLSPKDLTKVDLSNILDPNIRRMFTNVNDYDQAIAIAQKGEELYVGIRQVKGKKAELLLLKPTQKHQVELQQKKLLENLDKMLVDDPLLQREAIIDGVHNGMTRNYKDKIIQWMPELDDNGNIIAMDAAGEFSRKGGLKEWHKTFDELDEGIDFVKPRSAHEALLRLDEDSLEAMMFTPAQRKRLERIRGEVADRADVIQDDAAREAAKIKQDMSIGLVDRHRALAIDVADNVERRFNSLYEKSAAVSNKEYLDKNLAMESLLKEQRNFIGKAVVDARTNPNAFGVRSPRGNVDVEYDLANKRGMTFEEAIEDGFFGKGISDKRFIESVRNYLIDNGAMKATDKADELAKQILEIKSLRLPADTWSQMKTFNEISGMASLPELETPLRAVQNWNTLTKAGQLSTSPATGVRDGMSSYAQGVLMGDMDPAAIFKHGKAAWSFTKGMAIDPGEGIADIEKYLAARGIPSTAESRGRVFQDMFNAHHMHGSPNPDIMTADAFRLAESDSSMALLRNKAGGSYNSMADRLKNAPSTIAGTVKFAATSPIQAAKTAAKKTVSVQGMWTKDDLGRQVQRSVGENPVVNTMNDLRSMIDTTVRTTFILDRVKKTGSMAQALADADRILLNANPKNFTRFEHKWMKSIIPYYSFMRQTLPLFATEMMVNPGGKLGMVIRATRLGQGGEEDYVPYQYLDSAAIPLGETDEGQLKYLTSLGLMHEDAVKYAGNALQGDLRGLMQHALSSSNPAMKWLIESSTNTSLFSQGPMGGRRLDDLDPTMGRIALNLGLQSPNASGRPTPVIGPISESVAAMSPVSRLLSTTKIATDKRLSPGEKVWRLLTGVRMETVERDQITRDLRDRLNAMQIKLGARPLTIVSGAEKLKEFALANGDTETAMQLEQIEKALAMQKKLDREASKTDEDKPQKDSRKALIDKLRALR